MKTKKRKVINPQNMPINMPILNTMVFYLMLEHLNSPGYVWGVIGTVVILGWIVWIIDILTRETLEPFGGE